MNLSLWRAIGPVLGIASVVLWFMPLVNVEPSGAFEHLKAMFPEGVTLYQAGQHIGGIAYVLLGAGAGYAYCTWRRQRVSSAVFAVMGLLICAVLAVEAGKSVAWGLVALLCVFGASLLHAAAQRPSETR